MDGTGLTKVFKRILFPFKWITKIVKQMVKDQKQFEQNVEWLQKFLNGKMKTLNV